MKCLIPKCRKKATKHHWPVSKANGGKFTVPLCRMHHNMAHAGDEYVVGTLIQRAPTYWGNTEMWKYCQRQYFDWLARHKIKPADENNHDIIRRAGDGLS